MTEEQINNELRNGSECEEVGPVTPFEFRCVDPKWIDFAGPKSEHFMCGEIITCMDGGGGEVTRINGQREGQDL